MSFSWNPENIVCVCDSEADIEPLVAAGYQAIIMPGVEDQTRLPRAEHYVVLANGGVRSLAEELVASGVCKDWQVSTNAVEEFTDLTHAAEVGGIDLVRKIIRQSRSLWHEEAPHPFIEVQRPENIPSWKTGWTFLDPYIRYSEAEFGVFAGPYGGGKSALAQMLACDFADVAGRQLGATTSICAWEDAEWKVRRNIERFAVTREDMRPMKGPGYRTTDLLQRVFRITCERHVNDRTIDWYLQRCELLLRRENCRYFIFDPWNQHDEVRETRDSETQYVNKMLKELCAFAHTNKVIIIVVTHISAKSFDENGGIRPFRIAQAHGSSHFGKMADRGVCVFRTRTMACTEGLPEDERNRMGIRFDKSKDEETMGKLDTIAVKFDPKTMNISMDNDATEEIREAWRF